MSLRSLMAIALDRRRTRLLPTSPSMWSLLGGLTLSCERGGPGANGTRRSA